MEKLRKIQVELKAPKDKYNNFGKYAYRSAEGILEAVKPLLEKYECTLTLTDEIALIGDRYYVRATAMIVSGGERVCVSALAREEDSKKGMDGSQITGTASSYARKYALNGLFLIDDTKDADTDEYANIVSKTKKKEVEDKQEQPRLAELKEKIMLCRTLDEISGLWDKLTENKSEFSPEEWDELKKTAAEWGKLHPETRQVR